MEAFRIDQIRKAPIFGALDEDTIHFLLSSAKDVCLKDQEFLFKEGDPGDWVYLIFRGVISIVKSSAGKNHVEMIRFGRGDVIGEMSVFDMCPRSASAQSQGASLLLSWQYSDFLTLYERNLEQFAILQMNIGREISRRLRRMDDQMSRLIAKQASIVE